MRFLILAFGVIFLLSACNTMEGFGQDVEKLGNKISNKADRD